MVEIYGKEIAETSGFNVYAAANSNTQEAAQKAVLQNLHDYDERHGYRGPLQQLWTDISSLSEEQLSEIGIDLPKLTNKLLAQSESDIVNTVLDDDAAEDENTSTETEQITANSLKTNGEIESLLDLLSEQQLEQIQALIGPVVPLSSEEIESVLEETPEIAPLFPAVVIASTEQSITVQTQYHESLEISWDGLDWARPYIDDRTQGPEPDLASDIVSVGALIYVRLREKDKTWQIAQYPIASGAFVAIDPYDGAVQAIVGGYSFYQSQFNRAVQAKRQVGSNIKPFIYAAALDSGYTLSSIINDAPINQWNADSGIAWRPQNSPAVYDGPIRMRVALGKSKNVVSVRLLRGVGLTETRDYLTKFGFLKDEIPLDETMSLGSGSHTPMEVATAMTTIANGGFAVRPYVIQRIEDSFGEKVWEAEPLYACDPCQVEHQSTQEKLSEEQDIEARLEAQFNSLQTPESPEKVKQSAPRVISEQTAFLVGQMLRTAVRANGRFNTDSYWIGTGWRARNLLQRTDIGGKTGTTNDSRDTWFSGFAPGLVATSWVGFDDNARQLGRATRNQNLINKNPQRFNFIGNALIGSEDGAKAAQPAWIYFMQDILDGVTEQDFSQPNDVVRIRIDRRTGKLTMRTDASSVFEYFIKGTEPTTYVTDEELSFPVEQISSEQDDDLIEEDIF